MKTFLMSIALTVALVFMSIADFQPDSPLRLGFVRNAEAIIGMPRTPLSVAGVARRSMYREAAVVSTVAVTSAAAANALPRIWLTRTLLRHRLLPQILLLRRQRLRTLLLPRPPPSKLPLACP